MNTKNNIFALLIFLLSPIFTHAFTYENAEDQSVTRWIVPLGANILNIFDNSINSRVIQFNSNSYKYFKFKNIGNNSYSNISWKMRTQNPFNLYIYINTNNGKRCLYYNGINQNHGKSGIFIHHGLGRDAINNQWHQFDRDLNADLKEYEPNNNIVSIESFKIRSVNNFSIDDFKLFNINPTVDTTPPVITLNGDSNITLTQGSAYIEQSATAVDAVDGNVSVTISGVVDSSTVGTYTITYLASDSSGNSATKERQVNVVAVSNSLIIEDAEDGVTSRWITPLNATINNIFDSFKGSRILEFNSSSYKYYRMHGSINNSTKQIFQWDMKVANPFYLYIYVKTVQGDRVLYYNGIDRDRGISGTFIHHGLGREAINNQWHTFRRDLNADIKEYEPNNQLTSIESFKIKASGKFSIDNVELFRLKSDSDTDVSHYPVNYGDVNGSFIGDRKRSVYEENITLPTCDASNPEVQFIYSSDDWAYINSDEKYIFCVSPGDYSNIGRVTLTKSGSPTKKRYILLNNGNNEHPGKLEKNQLAKVSFKFLNTNYWVVDRMAYWDSNTTFNPITINNSDNNIINRYYLYNVGNGIYLYPGSDNNVIQNSRMERDNIDIFYDRTAIGLYNDSHDFVAIKNTKILNNEIVNFVDGVQLIYRGADSFSSVNYEGTIIDNNDIYIDKRIYTDCSGHYDTNGSCAYAENAIDLKVGSENPNNPLIITNNKMWGFRISDKTNSSLSAKSTLTIHVTTNNFIINKNLFFNSVQGISIAAPSDRYVTQNSKIKNNIFYNINKLSFSVSNCNNLEISSNLIKNVPNPYWIAFYNNKDVNFSNNLIVQTNSRNKLSEDNTNMLFLDNQYYQASPDEITDSSDILCSSDPTENYVDFTFTTDNFTTTPRNIRILKVLNRQ